MISADTINLQGRDVKTIDIQAFEDRSHPAGGHAVICLIGLPAIARNAAFVLRPLDGTLDDQERERWPKGEQAPIETRTSEAGVELVVGPGLVDNPLLVPGTPVMIDLPHEGVCGEFLWPSVALPQRPRRRSVQAPSLPQARTQTTIPMLPEPPQAPGVAVEVQPRGRSAPVERSRRADNDDVGPRRNRADSGDDPVFYASARAPTGAEPMSERTRGMADLLPQSRAGAAAVAVALLLAAQASVYALTTARRPADLARDGAGNAPRIETLLFDAFQAGATSPGGAPALGIAPARMLEMAHASLNAEGVARNTDEAAYWLKRYLATAASDERARRAVTQLGSTFAAPSRGAPDYVSARQMWEIAAAQGDPVAMCFIARLYDAGLGGAADKEAARRWTDMAQPLGGCAAAR